MIRGKMLVRIETVKIYLNDADEFFASCAFERANEYANCAGEMADAVCADCVALADCLRGAKNAVYGAHEFWNGLADLAESLARAAERVCNDCIEMLSR